MSKIFSTGWLLEAYLAPMRMETTCPIRFSASFCVRKLTGSVVSEPYGSATKSLGPWEVAVTASITARYVRKM